MSKQDITRYQSYHLMGHKANVSQYQMFFNLMADVKISYCLFDVYWLPYFKNWKKMKKIRHGPRGNWLILGVNSATMLPFIKRLYIYCFVVFLEHHYQLLKWTMSLKYAYPRILKIVSLIYFKIKLSLVKKLSLLRCFLYPIILVTHRVYLWCGVPC